MSREIARARVRDVRAQVRVRADEAIEAAGSAVWWAKVGMKALVCLGSGRHRWRRWEPSISVFAPPERRMCARCGGTQYRGVPPKFNIRVERGSMVMGLVAEVERMQRAENDRRAAMTPEERAADAVEQLRRMPGQAYLFGDDGP